MKNKNSILVIGGITLLITVLIFLLGIENGKRAIDYVSLLFVIIGECITFGMLAFYKHPTMFSSLSVSSLMPVYLIINILFSLLFKNLFVHSIPAFCIIHLVLIAIFAILIVVLSGVTNDINKNEETTIQQKAVIDECERIAQVLSVNSRFEKHRTKLEEIYDTIKYSDHVSDYKSAEILTVLNAISNSTNETETDMLCEKALQLIQERNITVTQLKRGGF